MNSPSSKWLTTLRVNFSKEVRRPCSVSAGCCFRRGGSRVSVWVRGEVEGESGGDVVSEEKRGQALQKWGPRTMWVFFFCKWSGVSDRPAGGAVSKRERAERLAWTEAAVICWKAPYYTVIWSARLRNYTDNLRELEKITYDNITITINLLYSVLFSISDCCSLFTQQFACLAYDVMIFQTVPLTFYII